METYIIKKRLNSNDVLCVRIASLFSIYVSCTVVFINFLMKALCFLNVEYLLTYFWNNLIKVQVLNLCQETELQNRYNTKTFWA